MKSPLILTKGASNGNQYPNMPLNILGATISLGYKTKNALQNPLRKHENLKVNDYNFYSMLSHSIIRHQLEIF